MIPASENNRHFAGTGWKEAKKSLNSVGNLRKMMKQRSSISTGKFSDFFREFTSVSFRKERKASQKPMEKIWRLSSWNTS